MGGGALARQAGAVSASIGREQPVVDEGRDLSALVRIDLGRIESFHDKHGIYDRINRLAVKVRLGRPTLVATAIAELNTELLPACLTPRFRPSSHSCSVARSYEACDSRGRLSHCCFEAKAQARAARPGLCSGVLEPVPLHPATFELLGAERELLVGPH